MFEASDVDEGEEVGRPAVISSCDAAEVLELVEAALDEVSGIMEQEHQTGSCP